MLSNLYDVENDWQFHHTQIHSFFHKRKCFALFFLKNLLLTCQTIYFRVAYNTGQWNTNLNYFDGIVNLTYAGGTIYNDPNNTPRKSEIVFKCDPEAGVGTPKYVTEAASNHTYLFEWRTRYACPSSPVECALVDDATKNEYDLSK